MSKNQSELFGYLLTYMYMYVCIYYVFKAKRTQRQFYDSFELFSVNTSVFVLVSGLKDS